MKFVVKLSPKTTHQPTCKINTANKHIGISIWSAEHYVPWPSTVRLKLKFQPSNRFMVEYFVSYISQKFIFFYVRLYKKTFAMNLLRTTQTVSLQRDNYNIKMCLNSSEISIIFSSANTVSSIYLILNIPWCFLYKGRWMMWFMEKTCIF